MTLQTPCLLYSSKTQRLVPFLDQKTTATRLRVIMDNRSFKYKTAFYSQIDPDGQLSQSQIYTQDTDFEGKMQPRQIQKQLGEQKVPVTIMSSITPRLSTEMHMRSGKAGAGVGRAKRQVPKSKRRVGWAEVSRDRGDSREGMRSTNSTAHLLSLPC